MPRIAVDETRTLYYTFDGTPEEAAQFCADLQNGVVELDDDDRATFQSQRHTTQLSDPRVIPD